MTKPVPPRSFTQPLPCDIVFESVVLQDGAYVYHGERIISRVTGHTLYNTGDVLRLQSLREELCAAFDTLVPEEYIVEKLPK